jgi:hypothetical protein
MTQETAMNNQETRFTISKHSSGYYQVSIPNYEGGEVVMADRHAKLGAALRQLARWFHGTHNNVFGFDIKTCGHDQCQAAIAALNPKDGD